MNKVIVVDDEMMIRKSLQEQLRKHRLSVAAAGTLAQAKTLLQKDQFDLVFIDMNLPDGEGCELLEFLTNQPNNPMAIMMTGSGSVESAVKCMKMGAADYITKPFSFQQIDLLLRRTKSRKELLQPSSESPEALQIGSSYQSSIIGESEAIRKLKNTAKKVALTEATVLITGENGTGKEELASEIHRLSSLADKTFVKVNCAAISENLLESEFFGHEKGAFTGATYQHKGRFELANEGTILLDEIGDISPRLQAMLLRVLQEGEFERVGGTQTLKVEVRVLATTNKDLKKAVQEGKFREDLFYRLNVFPIHVPPLRERGKDVLLLAKEFLKRFSRKHGKNLTKLSPEATECLLNYSFPGNVRELQNTIERAVILSEDGTTVGIEALDFIHAPALPAPLSSLPLPSPLSAVPASVAPVPYAAPIQSLGEAEKAHILSVWAQTRGCLDQTAQLLSIPTETLQQKLREYALDA